MKTADAAPTMAAQESTTTREPFAAYDAKRDVRLKTFKSACYAPFLSLDFFTTGQVQVCCENWAFPIGNVQTDPLKEIWTGPRIQQLREALKRYDFSHGCRGCEDTIRRGGRPFSMNYDMHRVDETSAWPRVMQFRLSNACNFACVMCDGKHSSVIRRDRDMERPLPRVYGERFFNELWEFFPHLDGIVFSGGEPFLIQENFRIWDMLIEQANTRTCLSIITNGSIWHEKILHYLERINVTHLLVSMDGATKETFEAVRLGSHFETVMANLKFFAEVVHKVRPRGRYGTKAAQFSFSYCLMPINFHDMPDVFLMAEAWDADVFVNVVTFPTRCTFLALQPSDIAQAHDALRHAYDRIQSRLSTINRQRYLEALSTVAGMAHDALEIRRVRALPIIRKIQSLDAAIRPRLIPDLRPVPG